MTTKRKSFDEKSIWEVIKELQSYSGHNLFNAFKRLDCKISFNVDDFSLSDRDKQYVVTTKSGEHIWALGLSSDGKHYRLRTSSVTQDSLKWRILSNAIEKCSLVITPVNVKELFNLVVKDILSMRLGFGSEYITYRGNMLVDEFKSMYGTTKKFAMERAKAIIDDYKKNYTRIYGEQFESICNEALEHLLLAIANHEGNLYNPMYNECSENIKKQLHKVTVIVGQAGTGKSTICVKHIANHVAGSVMIITLTNKLGINLKGRFKKVDIDNCEFYSIAKAQYTKNLEKHLNNKVVVIDEFSQWGVANLPLLSTIIDNARQVFIMGDTHQISSFLSQGNLLTWIISKMPEGAENTIIEGTVNRMTQLHRNNNTVGQAIFEWSKNPFNDISLTLDDNGVYTNKYDAMNWCLSKFKASEELQIITGSNTSAEILNNRIVKNLFNINDDVSEKDYKQTAFKAIMESKSENELILYATETHQIGKGKYLYNGDQIKVRRDVDGINIFSTANFELNINQVNAILNELTLGYAINIDKVQGLEWEYVLIWVDDPGTGKKATNYPLFKSFEASYVALTRYKRQMKILNETYQPFPSFRVTKFETNF